MTTSNSHATIDNALTEFLADQRERLSDRTFRRYEDVVQFLRHSLDGYAYSSLDNEERRRWEKEVRDQRTAASWRRPGWLLRHASDGPVRSCKSPRIKPVASRSAIPATSVMWERDKDAHRTCPRVEGRGSHSRNRPDADARGRVVR